MAKMRTLIIDWGTVLVGIKVLTELKESKKIKYYVLCYWYDLYGKIAYVKNQINVYTYTGVAALSFSGKFWSDSTDFKASIRL